MSETGFDCGQLEYSIAAISAIQPQLDLAQEVVLAMSCPDIGSKTQGDAVLCLFEKHADNPTNLRVIWNTFRGSLIQMNKNYDEVLTWIERGKSLASKTLVANLLGLQEALVSNGMVDEFIISQLVLPIENLKTDLHNKSGLIQQSYKTRRCLEVRPYSKALVNLVMEALRKAGKITLTEKSFQRSDIAFNYLCGIDNIGAPMKGPLAPSNIQPKDITGILLELDAALAAKRDDKNRTTRKGKHDMQRKTLKRSDIVEAMNKHFGVEQEKERSPRARTTSRGGRNRKRVVMMTADDTDEESQLDKDDSSANTSPRRSCKRKKTSQENNKKKDKSLSYNDSTVDPLKDKRNTTECTNQNGKSQRPMEKKGLSWERQLLSHGHEPGSKVLTEYPPSILLQATSLVFPEIVSLLNEKGCTLDLLLQSGRRGRQKLKLSRQPKKRTTLKATCNPVTTKEIQDVFLEGIKKGDKIFLVSPMVVSIEGVFNEDFKEKYLDVVDGLLFCKDKSGKGKSSNRASIYRPDECVDHEDMIFMANAEERMLPLIKLGLSNAIQAVEATTLESILHDIQTELSNLFIDAINETIERISGVGDLSDVPRWKERFERIVSGENEDMNQIMGVNKQSDVSELDNMEIDECSDEEEDESKFSDSCGSIGSTKQKRRRCSNTKASRKGTNKSGAPRRKDKCKRKGCAGISTRPLQKRGRWGALATKSSGGLSKIQKFFASLLSKSFFGYSQKRKSCRKIPRFKCNIVIAKCGTEASYGNHQDGSDILNSETLQFATYLGENSNCKRRLPTTGEFFVPTVILGRDGYTIRTKLVHRRGEHVLSSITTGNNSAHLQSPGCNSFGIYHGSSIVKRIGTKNKNLNLSRCVFTGRDGVDPKEDPEIYKERICGDGLSHSAIKKGLRDVHLYNAYNTCNVTKLRHDIGSPSMGCGGVPLWCYDYDDDENSELSSSGDAQFASPPPEKFAMLSAEDWEEFFRDSLDVSEMCGNDKDDAGPAIRGLRKPPYTIGTNKPKDKAGIVCNYKTTEHFLKAGKINHLIDTDGNNLHIQPLHTDVLTGRPLQVGQGVKRDEIPLTFTAYSKATIDQKYPNIFVLHHPYKNVPDPIDQHIEFYERCRNKMTGLLDLRNKLAGATRTSKQHLQQQLDAEGKSIKGELRRDYNNLPPLIVCGSGGSGNKAGDSGPSANVKSDECTYTMGEHQSPACPENMAMNLCKDRENAIALMVDLKAWRKPRRRNGNRGIDDNDDDEYDDEDDVDEESVEEEDQQARHGEQAGEEVDDEADITHNDDIMAGLDDEELNDRFFFLNYFVVAEANKVKLQPWEIEERFSRLPGYPSIEQKYLSYLVHDHYEFRLQTAFDFDTIMDCFEREKYTDMQVVYDGPVRFRASDIQKFSYDSYCRGDKRNKESIQRMFPKQPAEHAPENWVGRGQVIDYLKQQDIGSFERAIGAMNHGIAVTKRDRRYRVEPDELIPVVIAMMAAASIRFNKSASTRQAGGKKVAVIPPTAVGADRLPQEMRRSAKPCANPDADVMTSYFRKEASNFLSSKKFKICDEQFQGTFEVPDLRIRCNCEVVGECLLMALVSRLTGKVPMLTQFTKWMRLRRNGVDRHGGRCLPTSAAADDFIEFVNSNKGTSLAPYVSDQHKMLLPKAFRSQRTGKKNFCKFLKRFSNKDNEEGMMSIVNYLQHAASEDEMNRRNLRDIIGMAINACSSVQVCKNLDFLVHKAIADVESIFPGFAGEVFTSSIGFGSGSRLGLRILTRDLHQKSDAARLDWVFEMVSKKLECLHDDELLAMGYKRRAGIVVSWLSGREFSRTDVEHWCCKVYICMNACHPSRTVSKKPVHKTHCWPLPVSGAWVEALEDKFEELWGAFLRLDSDYLEKNYPRQLCFQLATY